METGFLTDAQAWVCFCAARLAELGIVDGDDVARELYRDERLGQLAPIAAAELQAKQRQRAE